jgi:outer membrane protein assembly factor BamB
MRVRLMTVVLILLARSVCSAWEHRYGAPSDDATLALLSDGDVIVGRCVPAEGSTRSLVARLSALTGKHRWQVESARSPFCGLPPRLVVTPDDDVLAVTSFYRNDVEWQRLVRLSGADGRRLWRTDAQREGREELALRADGSFVVSNNSTRTIAALDAATGATLWEAALDVAPMFVYADAQGDVLVSANTGRTNSDFIVIMLGGASGLERWRYVVSGDAVGGAGDDISWDAATDVVTDVAGDVIAVGWLSNQVPPPTNWDFQPMVVKLARDTGGEIWRRMVLPQILAESRPTAFALTPEGDVVVAIGGFAENDVVKLAGSSGDELWRSAWPTALDEEPVEGDFVRTLLADQGGNLLAVGRFHDRVTVAGFDGSSGERLWLRSLLRVVNPGYRDTTYPLGLVLGPRDEVVLGGLATREYTRSRLSVIAFGAALAGKRLVIRDDGVRRTMRVVLRDPLLQPAVPDGPGDPAIDGASMRLTSAADGGILLPLPASGWSRIRGGGFRYDGAEDGCTTVVLRSGLLRARCGWQDDAFSLLQPLGAVDVQFTVGEAGGFVQCATFGGTVVTDRAVAAGKPGRFKATDAPRPANCDQRRGKF